METDRELLEAAARAAGFRCYRVDDLGRFQVKTAPLLAWMGWSPLTDDGDALRLVVKLRLVVHVWDDCDRVSTAKTLPDGADPQADSPAWHCAHAHPCGGFEAAARRAIVRAAAALATPTVAPVAETDPR